MAYYTLNTEPITAAAEKFAWGKNQLNQLLNVLFLQPRTKLFNVLHCFWKCDQESTPAAGTLSSDC